MRTRSFALALGIAAALTLSAPRDASAQVERPPEPAHGAAQTQPSEAAGPLHKELGPADIIMPHLTDSKHVELPCFKNAAEWACEFELPTWKVAGIDFGPTKHVVFLFLAAFLTGLMLVLTARKHVKATREIGRPRGFAAGLEAVMLYLRNEVFMPVIGHGGERYIPFVLTLFFFILFCNLFGLVPYGSTPTGNIAVTATLAAITFVVVEVAGMRALGKGYIGTIIYWPHDMPIVMKSLLTIIMTPVEIIGKFTKPFALTVRLFANMVAGHVIILALIGLIFSFGWAVAGPAELMALGIMLLEILVAFIQAFIFALLASVFIGQIRAAHH
jgi:F-type H+-transporting ATPase subunit a